MFKRIPKKSLELKSTTKQERMNIYRAFSGVCVVHSEYARNSNAVIELEKVRV